MTPAELRQAMAVIRAALHAATPEVPAGQDPLTVPGWRELRDAWGAYHQLRRYFGIPDPPPAEEAAGELAPYDLSRVNKWGYGADEAAIVFPTLTRDPPREGRTL
jgi:hypothetical protein